MKLKKLIFSENFTYKKSYNLLLAKFQWKILKNSKLITYPAALTICPGNICNLKCVLCPTGQNDPGRSKGLLSLGLFQKIMQECGPYLWELDLYNWGEPLLNRELFEMVRYAKRFKMRVTVSTNLNHFNDSICKDFVLSGLDEVVVSLDGSSQESVSKYQVGNDFNKVIANIKRLADCRKELNRDTPRITWRFLVNRYNENEIAEAENLRKAAGVDTLKIDKFRCDMGKELLLDNDQKFNNIGSWLPLNESLPSYNYGKGNRGKQKSCRWLWLQAAINWNGSVSPCCAVWDEKYDFGSIRRSSFKTIWNSAKYREARKIAAKGILKPSDNICSICHINNSVV